MWCGHTRRFNDNDNENYDHDIGNYDDENDYDENANTTLQKLLGCTTYFTVRLLIDGKYHNSCREFFKSFMFDLFSVSNNNKLQENIPVLFTF